MKIRGVRDSCDYVPQRGDGVDGSSDSIAIYRGDVPRSSQQEEIAPMTEANTVGIDMAKQVSVLSAVALKMKTFEITALAIEAVPAPS